MLFSIGEMPSAGVVTAVTLLASSALFQIASAGNAFGCLSGKNGPNTYQYGTDIPNACQDAGSAPVLQYGSQPEPVNQQPAPARRPQGPNRPYRFDMPEFNVVVTFEVPRQYSSPPPALASYYDANALVIKGQDQLNREMGNRPGSASPYYTRLLVSTRDNIQRGQVRDLVLDGQANHDITFNDCNAVIEAFGQFIDRYAGSAAKAGKPPGIPNGLQFHVRQDKQIIATGKFEVVNAQDPEPRAMQFKA